VYHFVETRPKRYKVRMSWDDLESKTSKPRQNPSGLQVLPVLVFTQKQYIETYNKYCIYVHSAEPGLSGVRDGEDIDSVLASSSHFCSRGFNLHIFLKLRFNASNRDIVVWEKSLPYSFPIARPTSPCVNPTKHILVVHWIQKKHPLTLSFISSRKHMTSAWHQW